MKEMKLRCLSFLLVAATALGLTACGGGGGNSSASSSSSTGGGATTIASILIDTSKSAISTDGVDSAIVTIRALDVSNALVKGAALAVSGTGNIVLSASSVTTDASTGIATITVSANSADQSARTATIRVACSGCTTVSKDISVQGASLTLSQTATSVAVGATTTLTATIKDVNGQGRSGVLVSFASTDTNLATVADATATTNSSGVASTLVSGVAATAGVNINVAAIGNSKSATYSVTAAAASLSIVSPSNNALLVTGANQTVSVSVPVGVTQVNFSSTIGSVTPSTAAVSSGTASAVFSSAQAGVATITASATSGAVNLSSSVVVNVSPPVSAASKLLLTSGQTTLGLKSGSNTPSVRISARAVTQVGSSDQGVANVPVNFSMTGGPGAGEYLSVSTAYTDAAGYAYADFYSGTAASSLNGIDIKAAIVGSAVATGIAPSSNDLLLTIGGQALSVAFGEASVLRENADKTLYIMDYSLVVTDANGNPVPNVAVNLRVAPIAFSTGTPCTVVATYCSEDHNQNGSLDLNEDGFRRALSNNLSDISTCTSAINTGTEITGTIDQLLTPQNSTAGALPSSVTVGADGTGKFSLTYLKASALWIVDRITATVSSSGTESSSSTIFRLPATTSDSGSTCYLPSSPFRY